MIAQAVDQVVSRGVAYFAFAGNFARNSWENITGFNPSGVFDPDGEFHQFGMNPSGNAILTQFITLPRINNCVPIILLWAEPYISASGVAGKGSASDVEIFIRAGNLGLLSAVENNIGSDPIERNRHQSFTSCKHRKYSRHRGFY